MDRDDIEYALAGLGIQLAWKDGRLKLIGDTSGLTPEVRRAMAENRTWLEDQYRPTPTLVLWRMPTAGVVLISLLGPTTVEEDLRKHRCYLNRQAPLTATGWTLRVNGEEPVWRPMKDLPAWWGLRSDKEIARATEEEERGEG